MPIMKLKMITSIHREVLISDPMTDNFPNNASRVT